MTWIKKWEVGGTDKVWIVSLSDTGTWGCSCPVWKFKRVECHHIDSVRSEYEFDKKEYTELEIQLLNVIKRCMDKLTTERKTFNIPINDDFNVGINNVGIGRVGTSKLDGSKQVYKINDLETYLVILKNKKAIGRIKRYIHKKEKKEMLDVLYKYLNNWEGLTKKKQEKAFMELFEEITPYLMIDAI